MKEHFRERYEVAPGFKIFDSYIIGIPPILVGIKGTQLSSRTQSPATGPFFSGSRVSKRSCVSGTSDDGWWDRQYNQRTIGEEPLARAGTFILAVGVCYLAAAVGSVITGLSVNTWYSGLAKPPFTPPGWFIGAVWTVLFLLMGIPSSLCSKRAGAGTM